MNNIVEIYSKDRDYLEDDYLKLFKEKNKTLIKGNEEKLKAFIKQNDIIQLDTETNVTDFVTDRELYVIQLGNPEGTHQIVIDVLDIEPSIDRILKKLFKSNKTFIAHNAKFEYIVLYRHYGICINNFLDTFLAAKVVESGLDKPKGYFSLASLIKIYLSTEIDKEEQSNFSRKKMTPSQVLYASTDVIYLCKLLNRINPILNRWKLNKVFKLENKTLRPIGDMTINGVKIDKDRLEKNIAFFESNAKEYKEEFVNAFKNDDDEKVQQKIKALNVIQKHDEVFINWNSPTQKKEILKLFYPDVLISSTAKKELINLEKTVDNPLIIKKILDKDTDEIEMKLVSRHRAFLRDNEMLKEKGDINLNLSSPKQLLEFFQIWYPKLRGTGVKHLKKLKHPVVLAFKKYTKAAKLVNSFGRKMYNYIEDDGRIHCNFNQLVPSGSRMSSSKPNMQQAPSTEQYRSMFVPEPGWKFIDSDYSSAELYIAAYLSKDKNLLEAIEKGYDLHSYSAYLIYGQKWLDCGGEKEPKGKPKTKQASKLRGTSKGLSFSLLYGTGVTSFSENNGVELNEGKRLMKKYYDTFPQLAKFFKDSGQHALEKMFVRDPYFGRIRFFDRPKNGMEASHNKNAGMNYPPQSINGSIMKYALCLMKKYIEENNLEKVVKLVLTVHDQQLSEVRDDYVDLWKVKQTEIMERAALFVVKSGALKAESDVLEHWTKG